MSSQASREFALGIDFGSTNSSAAAVIDGRVQLVLDGGDPQVPSVIFLPRRGEPLVGAEAVKQGHTDPAGCIRAIKRLLGRRYDDPLAHAVDGQVGYKIVQGGDGSAVLRIRDAEWAPAQLVGVVLSRLRAQAERRFGGKIKRAVMTVPVESSPGFLSALRRAAGLAQLEVIRFVPEPVAGVLAYGLHSEPTQRRIAVCDFGGGTFDATLIQQTGSQFSPVAVDGDSFLGGEDFDDALADAIAGVIFRSSRADIRRDLVKWSELRWRCESTKRQLSNKPEARLHMPDAYVTGGARQNIDLMIERKWIEPRWQPLIDRASEVANRLLASASWSPKDVECLVLIGGTARIPLFQRAMATLFGREGLSFDAAGVAPAVGAALIAAAQTGASGVERKPSLSEIPTTRTVAAAAAAPTVAARQVSRTS